MKTDRVKTMTSRLDSRKHDQCKCPDRAHTHRDPGECDHAFARQDQKTRLARQRGNLYTQEGATLSLSPFIPSSTYPQHLLGGGGILLERLQQLDGVLGGFVRSDALCERLDARGELTFIHGRHGSVQRVRARKEGQTIKINDRIIHII